MDQKTNPRREIPSGAERSAKHAGNWSRTRYPPPALERDKLDPASESWPLFVNMASYTL